MGKISYREFVMLISKYLDTEKLIKDNPSVTRKMLDALFQEISHLKKEEDSSDICSQRHSGMQHRKKALNELIIHTDGASRGNPGKAGIGVAIFDKDYNPVEEVCDFIGDATNNVAEYKAMILAVQKAIGYQVKKVIFRTDSELLVRQLNGVYRVKSPNILSFYNELIMLLNKIPAWEIQHVRREENVHADILANQGIDISA